MDGLTQFIEDNAPTEALRTRRARASKLGESLYCRGGYQKILSLSCFPKDHIGICGKCIGDTLTTPHVSQLDNDPDSSRASVIPTQNQPLRIPQRGRVSTACFSSSNTMRLSNHSSRRNRNTALTGSVTTHSDAGEYPSERSTYGGVKPSQTGVRKCSVPRMNKGLLIGGQLPGEKAISERINEVEGFCQYLTSQEIHRLQLRRVTDIQTSHTVQNSTENNTTHLTG